MAMTKRTLCAGLVAAGLALVLTASQARLSAGQAASGSIPFDADDLGGIVTSATGPEAGVWVIAETTDLPTKFVKIVVTDDRGRYLLPDLPKASYNVWVRGYGLVDSPKVQAAPGRLVNLTAVWRQTLELPRSTTRPTIGGRCSRCPTRASSREQGPRGMASRRRSRARPSSRCD